MILNSRILKQSLLIKTLKNNFKVFVENDNLNFDMNLIWKTNIRLAKPGNLKKFLVKEI